MSYQALYRKYRPTTFDEVKGQEHIVVTLKNIISSRKIGHAYIFSGPRGVGKTSVARIFANVLNCMHQEDLTKACPDCYRLIKSNIDVIEMDAASNNGVDEIRDLKEKVELLPTYGRYKIYIIDEVHMLSKGAFNALLKTLEEPPAHAIFILATTDPQKIPLTILSRSQRFNFRRIATNVLSKTLEEVLSSEAIEFEKNALQYIARLASGGLRDALSIADQAAAYGLGKIRLIDIMYSFGLTSNENLIKIINYSFKNQPKELINLFNEIKDAGIDPIQFIQGLIGIIKDWIIFQKTRETSLLETCDEGEINNLALNNDYALEYINNLYSLLKEVQKSTSPYQLIEYGLIKNINLKAEVPKIPFEIYQNEIKNQQRILEQNQPKIVEQNVPNEALKTELAEEVIKMKDQQQKDKNIEQPLFKNNQSEFMKSINEAINMTNEITINNNELNAQEEDLEQDLFTKGFKFESVTDDNQIITTQEISLEEELKNSSLTGKNTSEFSMTFTKENPLNEQEEKLEEFIDIYDTDQILNALVQSRQSIISKYEKYNEIASFSANSHLNLKEQIKLLSNLKLLCASDNFLLVYTDNDVKLNTIKNKRNTKWIQDYFVEFYGSMKSIIPVSKEAYKQAVEKFKKSNKDELKKNIKQIELPNIEGGSNNEEEDLLKKIFGSNATFIKK
ncbi:DNA polymerase III subunit gamma/tau [Mycoplasma crocodyli]|uniref:DNA polymerase III subunit gamma/tau n=1 Tax=Mycoplasma crocodyli (strain ATCC 51981 / MP145) TaxID=512564 RepID=D5E6E1_MYCCM|nr:DNA polymerase III subunit gamma/tau [Mycoplasma crocodyli]ADE19681.1 DNA polymerase III, gamma and tau subunit [Mycoplasma crocodyli MP145]